MFLTSSFCHNRLTREEEASLAKPPLPSREPFTFYYFFTSFSSPLLRPELSQGGNRSIQHGIDKGRIMYTFTAIAMNQEEVPADFHQRVSDGN